MLFRFCFLLSVLDLISAAIAGWFIPVTGASCNLASPLSRISRYQSIPLRRSITELAAESGPQWHLYIQALRAMYDKDPYDPESFFAIAGIHGWPFIEWNRSGPKRTDGWAGYSTHSEELFIIWHRPYVALFEQTLVKEAQKIAAKYPNQYRSIYQQAARDLRAPYWDWAFEPRLPRVALPEKVTIYVATETDIALKTVENPLLTFKFPREAMQGNFGFFSTLDRMYRCPNTSVADSKLERRNFKPWLYDTFVRSRTFSEFATTASNGGSLETVHNAVHWDTGCGGQFLDSQYSAFDPLFMIHHANVDRLWAYWQAIHPDEATFSHPLSCRARFSTPSGTLMSLDSPLQPFRQHNGAWHTPRSVNSIRTFGYAYPGLEYWNKSNWQLRVSAIEMINSLYGPNSATFVPSQPGPEPESKLESSTSSSTGNNHFLSPELTTTTTATTSFSKVLSTAEATANGMKFETAGSARNSSSNAVITLTTTAKRQFYANIAVDVSLLPFRPCSIEVFIDTWLAGSMVVMQMPERGILYDSIPLANALAAARLDWIPDDKLLEHITKELQISLAKPDGVSIDMDDSHGLQVRVEEVLMLPPASKSELSRVSKPEARVVVEESACDDATDGY